MINPHLVVVGSSAGGIEALSRPVSTLRQDFRAPVLIAQHPDPDRKSRLQEILSRRSDLPVRTVAEREALEPGVVYVVPADRHVNVTASEVDLRADGRGRPKPSVDLLMESAAEVFGDRLVAVVLSGTGSDGAAGARAVREVGGTGVIQDPETAELGGMPGSLAPNTVDVMAELDRVGPILAELLPGGPEVPAEDLEKDEKRSLEAFLGELRDSSKGAGRRLEAILSGMSDAVLAVGADGRALFSNDVFTRAFGDPGDRDAGPRLGQTVRLDQEGGELPAEELPQKRAARGEPFEMRFAAPEGGTLRLYDVRGRSVDGGVLVIRDAGLPDGAP